MKTSFSIVLIIIMILHSFTMDADESMPGYNSDITNFKYTFNVGTDFSVTEFSEIFGFRLNKFRWFEISSKPGEDGSQTSIFNYNDGLNNLWICEVRFSKLMNSMNIMTVEMSIVIYFS